ncbi:inositol polyphosphate 1-phosphatase, putative [Trypanosoma equiperdum]|uniref:3'(2'),5'-bisphosphate nucleotidase n=2 Tax=Trypanozoon TaxID=39700 RepID=Q57YS3_TRYB2|nr:inositol polyphosphate 1-phosphatase, putative [Trypanosoma brucei brucei TREU927]AAX69245.1 inositol polyphosphate 1-phosphatase, putative [Trypanosoma brucei]AAZ13480.1 inositol polyphosphate 1-phosphatase, putative [Trypanosoma brucei brucei TREU927]SCU71592.1 inositol polyphosphate 1-phosphatase, putative [Trypanosoma equiperdum]
MPQVDLVKLLQICVNGALAAQQYILLDLIQLRSLEVSRRDVCIADLDQQEIARLRARLKAAVSVDVKGKLEYKEGGSVDDLVTTADVVTQGLMERLLAEAFPDTPFTIIGEEEATTTDAIKIQVERCVEAFRDVNAVAPLQKELEAHASSDSRHVSASTVEELRARVGVFIDPIDATSCFVDGTWGAPMTLVGITVDGVPVAGVSNRFFYSTVDDLTSGGNAGCTGLSYVWNDPSAGPFIVHEGRLATPLWSLGRKTTSNLAMLRVIRSGTTSNKRFEQLLARLQPVEPRSARGAGNKLMLLVVSMLAASDGAAAAACDVFLAPPNSISKWDTCAAHAFLLALGGDMRTLRGELIRYPLRGTTNLKTLPDGVVGLTRWSMTEGLRRLGWQ